MTCKFRSFSSFEQIKCRKGAKSSTTRTRIGGTQTYLPHTTTTCFGAARPATCCSVHLSRLKDHCQYPKGVAPTPIGLQGRRVKIVPNRDQPGLCRHWRTAMHDLNIAAGSSHVAERSTTSAQLSLWQFCQCSRGAYPS